MNPLSTRILCSVGYLIFVKCWQCVWLSSKLRGETFRVAHNLLSPPMITSSCWLFSPSSFPPFLPHDQSIIISWWHIKACKGTYYVVWPYSWRNVTKCLLTPDSEPMEDQSKEQQKFNLLKQWVLLGLITGLWEQKWLEDSYITKAHPSVDDGSPKLESKDKLDKLYKLQAGFPLRWNSLSGRKLSHSTLWHTLNPHSAWICS